MSKLKWILGLFLLFLVISFFAIYYILSISVAPYDGEIEVTMISDDIQITFDEKGIPQIWAKTQTDGMFALGWLHASERLFQMDMTRKISQGTLSEVLGEVTINFDVESRKIGHYRIANEQQANLSNKNRTKLQAYADGVNGYVEQSRALPFEYYLLGSDFEKWSVFDCLTILSFQTWFSDALQNTDKLFAIVSAEKGVDTAKTLYFEYPEWAPHTVSSEIENHNLFKKAVAEALFPANKIPFVLTESSNSWAVSPSKSASGSAMLASDPHLDISRLPQFWYYCGLHIEEQGQDVLGITAAGLPFFTMGHNGQVAWAFTAGGVDITEYYEEQLDPQDTTRYLTPDGWKAFEVIPEKVLISGSEPLEFNVYKGIHGPLFYKNDSLKKAYAIDWAGFDTDLNEAVTAGFELSDVKDFNQYRRTVTRFGALDANWTYADKAGNIGYQLGTPVPVRPPGYKNMPIRGWENNRIWQGYYALDQTPNALNPEKGWLATANNKQQGPDLGYAIPGNFAADRILRLNTLLNSDSIFTIHDFMAMQLDIIDESLVKFVDMFSGPLRDAGPAGINLAEKLQNWDGYTGTESTETAFINLCLERLKKNIFEDELGKNYKYMRYTWLYQVLNEKEAIWFDDVKTEQVELRGEILKKSVLQAMEDLSANTWADLQQFKMEHPFAVIPGFGSMLGLRYGPISRAGTKGTLNASFNIFKDGKFNVVVGPSWRFIIDFANPDKINMVLPAGNSGNPMSPYFMNFQSLWEEGLYWQVSFNRDDVFKNASAVLTLKRK